LRYYMGSLEPLSFCMILKQMYKAKQIAAISISLQWRRASQQEIKDTHPLVYAFFIFYSQLISNQP
jgi:hypothetical protein